MRWGFHGRPPFLYAKAAHCSNQNEIIDPSRSTTGSPRRLLRLPTKFTNCASARSNSKDPEYPTNRSPNLSSASWKISTTRFSRTWSNMLRSERTSDLRSQNSDERPLEILQPEIEY